MLRTERVLALILILVLSGCGGCASKAAPTIDYSTLPTREVQAVFPDDFRAVHDAAMQCLRDGLGFTIASARLDDAQGASRIDAVRAGGSSARIEIRRDTSRPMSNVERTNVRVLAVQAGSETGDPQPAREILERLKATLWPNTP